jgi:hypothetical protein
MASRKPERVTSKYSGPEFGPITKELMKPAKRVTEEKMLNDLFVLLEYSDNFKEFVEGMTEDTRLILFDEIKRYYGG